MPDPTANLPLELAGYCIRDYVESDIEGLCRLGSSDQVWRHLGDAFPHPYTREDAEAWLEKLAAQNPRTHFAIGGPDGFCGGIGARVLRRPLHGARRGNRVLARPTLLEPGSRHGRRPWVHRLGTRGIPAASPFRPGLRHEPRFGPRAAEMRLPARRDLAARCSQGGSLRRSPPLWPPAAGWFDREVLRSRRRRGAGNDPRPSAIIVDATSAGGASPPRPPWTDDRLPIRLRRSS